jgi:hypothetical protein
MSDKATKISIGRIKEYLDGRAQNDAQFAACYAKPGKSLEGCVAYICNRVRKSGMTMVSSEEVFGWAVHYYDEDDIKDQKMPSGVRIVATAPAGEDAKVEVTVPRSTIRKPKSKKGAMKEPPHEPYVQLSLFD